MRLVTAESMRAVDRHAIDVMGIPGLDLMEEAGMGTVGVLVEVTGVEAGDRVVVVCGKGNNGGDGFVVARGLRGFGVEVDVFLLGTAADVTGDARTNLDFLDPGSFTEITDEKGLDALAEALDEADVAVDAIFGTGFSGEPRGLAGDAIAIINSSDLSVLAVDVPSGLDASTGGVEGECIIAEWTSTMAFPKKGFFLHPGREFVGDIHVVDIGIPKEAAEAAGGHQHVLTPVDAAALAPERDPAGHKGTFGHVAVVAGSVGYTGAATLASMSALRSGAGLVTLGVPSSLNDILEAKVTEVITRPLPESPARSLGTSALPQLRELIGGADAVAIGPGLSMHAETVELVRSIVSGLDTPAVIDADGLNALTPDLIGARSGDAAVVLTPHPGEMACLVGCPPEDVLADRERFACAVAEQARATVVLKGAATIIATIAGDVMINPTGNDGMATAGSGDVLTGIIAALLARGMSGPDAAALGAYVHGLAGDLAASSIGGTGMIAGDIMEFIPDAFAELEAELAEIE